MRPTSYPHFRPATNIFMARAARYFQSMTVWSVLPLAIWPERETATALTAPLWSPRTFGLGRDFVKSQTPPEPLGLPTPLTSTWPSGEKASELTAPVWRSGGGFVLSAAASHM